MRLGAGSRGRGRRGFAWLAAVATLLVPALAGSRPRGVLAASPVPVGPCGPIDRPWEVVVVRGGSLRGLGRVRIEHLGLVAFRGGVGHPIPFQVDERAGRHLALPGGPRPTRDDHPGVLDPADELAFVACDGGERGPAAELAALGVRGEIALRDPLDGHTAFVYVVVRRAPPRTDRAYVTYDPATDTVTTADYRVRMVDTFPRHLALRGSKGFGPDVLDRVKFRAEATLHGGLARWRMSERDMHSRLLAYRAGPVRLIRRTRHRVDIGLGIHLTAAVAHTYFGPRSVWAPGALRLPFSPGLFFRRASASGGADFSGLGGWRYLAPGVPEGFLIDGVSSPAELAFATRSARREEPAARSPATTSWFLLAGGGHALACVVELSQRLARAIELAPLYLDDRRPRPPEAVAGAEPFAGFALRGLERVGAGRHRFSVHIVDLGPYRPGAERWLLAAHRHPLAVKAKVWRRGAGLRP